MARDRVRHQKFQGQHMNRRGCKQLSGSTAVMLMLALPMAAGSSSAMAAEAATVAEALGTGKTTLNLRIRSEYVDDEALARTANAATVRSRLSYNSAAWQGLDLALELDHVAHIANDRFNTTRNGKPFYPQVPDPDGADLNQANIRYRQGDISLTLGRQRINRDNQRFVGGVAWRQNEQTFDAISGSWKVSDKLQLDYAWIDDTKRIFGPDKGTPPASLASAHHLFNAAWQLSPTLRAAAYYYALEFEDVAALSSTTAGVFVQGNMALESATLDYRAELATQRDHANNPSNYRARYLHATAGVTVNATRMALSHEILGADSRATVALQTPLATLHAFQGWADKFLTTPGTGLKDTWLSLAHKVGKVDLQVAVHDYRSDRGNSDFGQEWNLQASTPLNSAVTLTAKLADYRADRFARDARKFWLMAEARF